MKLGWRSLAWVLIVGGLTLSGNGIYLGTKAYAAQFLLDRAWAKTIKDGSPTLPWPWMDTVPIAKISVPKLGHSAIVLEGASGQALAFAPSHMHGTVMPGEKGLSVIAAHKNTHFGFLKDMRQGDLLALTQTDGTEIRFRMTNADIVHKDSSGIPANSIRNGVPRLALVTCYPFDTLSYGGPMRYVVYFETAPTLT